MHTGALTFSPRLQRCIAKPCELGRYRSFMRGVMKTLRHILSSPVTDRVLHKFGHITAIIYLGSNVRFNCINSASARDRTLRLVYLWEIVSLLPGMHRNAWLDAIFDACGIRSKPGNALRFFAETGFLVLLIRRNPCRISFLLGLDVQSVAGIWIRCRKTAKFFLGILQFLSERKLVIRNSFCHQH